MFYIAQIESEIPAYIQNLLWKQSQIFKYKQNVNPQVWMTMWMNNSNSHLNIFLLT